MSSLWQMRLVLGRWYFIASFGCAFPKSSLLLESYANEKIKVEKESNE